MKKNDINIASFSWPFKSQSCLHFYISIPNMLDRVCSVFWYLTFSCSNIQILSFYKCDALINMPTV